MNAGYVIIIWVSILVGSAIIYESNKPDYEIEQELDNNLNLNTTIINNRYGYIEVVYSSKVIYSEENIKSERYIAEIVMDSIINKMVIIDKINNKLQNKIN